MLRRRFFHRSVIAAVAFLLLGAMRADAVPPLCGDASDDGSVEASDALVALHAAVGLGDCPPPRCDCNDNGSVTAGDAMGILQVAVGSNIVLHCPAPDPVSTTSTLPTTTSSTLPAASTSTLPDTSTTTTLASGDLCGNGEVDPGEDCEPQTFCRGGCNPYTGVCVDFGCSDSCRCAPPRCGDWMIDAGEDCDPPGSACAGDGTCSDGCGCLH